MNRRIGTLLVGIVGAVALLAAACAPATSPAAPAGETGGSQSGTTNTAPKADGKQTAPAAVPQAEQGAQSGGVLTMASTNSPGHIPWEEAVTYAMQPIYPQANNIVQYQTWGDYGTQDYWNIVGDLAKSWEQSSDGLTWTFKFQDGIKWSDGQPFTCEDAKWSFDTIRTGTDLRRSPRAVMFRPVRSVDCTDSLTMIIKLSRPQSSFLELLAGGPNTVWAKHAYEGKANLDKMREDPKHIGTGPFTMTEFVPGEKYVLQRNANYWKKPYPYLDGIEIRLIATAQVPAAMRAGRLDMGYPASLFSGAQADQLQRECKDCQFFPRFTNIGFGAMHLNHQRPPWNTPAVKEAISYAIDRKKYADVCEQGWAVYETGIVHPDTPYGLPKERLAGIPGYNFNDPQGNKAKARDLLAKAGFKPGDLTLKATVWGGFTEQRFVCGAEDFEAVGINVQSTVVETARAYEIATAGDFELLPWGFLVVAADPDAVLYEHFYTGSDRNYGRYSNPEVDKLIDQQSATLDPEKRKALVWQIQEILLKEQAKLVLYHNQYMAITGPKVKNFLSGPTCFSQGSCFRMERVWLDQK